MSTARNDTLTPTAAEGPGFLSGALWAMAVLMLCTVAVGAAFQGAAAQGAGSPTDVVAAQAR